MSGVPKAPYCHCLLLSSPGMGCAQGPLLSLSVVEFTWYGVCQRPPIYIVTIEGLGEPHNVVHNKNQKTPKTWNTARYSVRYSTVLWVRYSTNRNSAQSLQENAITVFVPRLYNSLLKYLRDIESIKTEKLKFELDKFLELIPDEP